MGFKQFVAEMLGIDTKGETSMLVGNNSSPQYPDRNYAGLAFSGYKSNSIVYAGISKIATSCASVPVKIVSASDGSELKTHPTTELLKRPNPWASRYEFSEALFTFLVLSGNAFVWKVRGKRTGRVVELWNLRPDCIRIIPSEENFISSYKYRLGCTEYDISIDDMIHIRLPNPGDEMADQFFGASPLLSAIKPLGTDNEAFDYANTVLTNHGIPSTIIIGEAAAKWDETLKKRFREAWVNNFAGNNRGKYPNMLQGVKEVVQLGYNLDQLAFSALTSLNETRILAALGVPGIVIGAQSGLDKATYANYETARDSFWQETVVPYLTRFGEAIDSDEDLTPKGSGTVAAFDYSGVPSMQKAESAKEERARASYINGIITRNEARERIGLEPVEGGDDFHSTGSAFGFGNGYDEQPAKDDEPPSPTPSGKSAPACSHSQGHKYEKKSAAVRDALKLIRHAQGRNAIADKMVDKLLAVLRKEGKLEAAQVEQIYSELDKLEDALQPSAIEKVVSALETVRPKWTERLSEMSRPIFVELANAAGEHAAGAIGASFNVNNSTTLNFLKDYSFRFADKYGRTSADDVREVLLRSSVEGLTPQKAKQELISRMQRWSESELAQSRAEMIARTEVIRCANAGAKEAYKQAGITKVSWLAVDDACPFCLEMASRPPVLIDAPFVKKGDTVAASDEEGNPINYAVNYEDVDEPPLHPNCLVGETPVLVPDVISATVATYCGPIIEATFSNGARISVTPNHMLLTPQGWICAKSLRKGDDIFYSADFERIVAGNPNNHGRISTIKEIVDSLAKTKGMASVSVPASPEYLHGDARIIHGNIDVITPDCLLSGASQSVSRELLDELNLCSGYSKLKSLPGCGDLASMLLAMSRSSDSIMGGRCEFASFSRRESLHPDLIGFASSANCDIGLQQPSINSASAAIVPLGQCDDAFSGSVSLAQVVDVKIQPFHGNVYDLQSRSSMYIANSILSSNCRCTLIADLED